MAQRGEVICQSHTQSSESQAGVGGGAGRHAGVWEEEEWHLNSLALSLYYEIQH